MCHDGIHLLLVHGLLQPVPLLHTRAVGQRAAQTNLRSAKPQNVIKNPYYKKTKTKQGLNLQPSLSQEE